MFCKRYLQSKLQKANYFTWVYPTFEVFNTIMKCNRLLVNLVDIQFRCRHWLFSLSQTHPKQIDLIWVSFLPSFNAQYNKLE